MCFVAVSLSVIYPHPPPEELRARRLKEQQQQVFLVNLHLLANPGDSLLLQHTADQLLRWLCPSLRIFHVSERASPLREYSRPSRLGPLTGRRDLLVVLLLKRKIYI